MIYTFDLRLLNTLDKIRRSLARYKGSGTLRKLHWDQCIVILDGRHCYGICKLETRIQVRNEFESPWQQRR